MMADSLRDQLMKNEDYIRRELDKYEHITWNENLSQLRPQETLKTNQTSTSADIEPKEEIKQDPTSHDSDSEELDHMISFLETVNFENMSIPTVNFPKDEKKDEEIIPEFDFSFIDSLTLSTEHLEEMTDQIQPLLPLRTLSTSPLTLKIDLRNLKRIKK